MRAVVAVIRAPFYSIRVPVSYQAAISYPLPPPTTLLGSLAFAMSTTGVLVGTGDRDVYVESCVKEVFKLIRWVTVKPLSVIKRESYILSRLRTLEPNRRKSGTGEKPTDAMVREYYGGTLAIIYLLTENRADRVKEVESSLYAVERLGDTESLISVDGVCSALVEPLPEGDYHVDTYFPLKYAKPDSLRGSILLYDMHPMEFSLKVKRNLEDMKELEPYALPLKETGKGILSPTKVRVQPAEGCRLLKVKVERNIGMFDEAVTVMKHGI